MASVPDSYSGRQGSTPWRRTSRGLVGEWSPRRPVKAKTASSNLVEAASWRARFRAFTLST
jgi:hypothetical protein